MKLRPSPGGPGFSAGGSLREKVSEERDRTEDELIARARCGEAAAFGELVHRHQDRIFALMRPLVPTPVALDDVAQEVFLRAYRHLPRFEGRARFSTWLYRIAINTCRTYRRRHFFRTQALSHTEDAEYAESLPGPDPPPDRVLEDRDLRRVVREGVAALKPRFREALVLVDLEELSYEEAATVAGVTLNTLKTRLWRARRQFRETLEARSGPQS